MSFISFITPCIAAFIACIGFSFLYNIHGKNILVASVCGAVAWAVYLIVDIYVDSLCIPFFVSGMSIALYSEIAAYVCKAPVTVYLIPGIIPLVPGLTIFRTMEACLTGEVMEFSLGCINTLKIGGSIAIGLIFISSLFRLIRTVSAKRKIKF